MRTSSSHARTTALTLMAGLSALVLAAPAGAGTVAGTVTKFDWTNPHVYIELAVADAKGGTGRYTIECASPNVLTRVGWKFNTVKVGDKVSALINPLRNGQPGGMLETLTTPDGQTLSDSNPPGGTFER